MTFLKAFRTELILLLCLAGLYSIFISLYELNTYTELPLFESARQLLAGEAWEIPSIDSGNFSPLMVGILTVAFKFFGVSIATARIPAIILTAAGLLLTYITCMVTIKSRTTALLSTATLGTSLGFFGLAPLSGSGILLTDVILLSIISVQVWINRLDRRKPQPEEIRNACWFIGLSCGLLFVTQGWLAWLWVGAAIAIYLLNTQMPRMTNAWHWQGFTLGLALPITTWVLCLFLLPLMLDIPASPILGWQGLWKFLLTSGIGSFSLFQNNILLQLATLLLGMMPYLFFVGGFGNELLWHRRTAGPSHMGKDSLILFAALLFVSLLLAWAFSPANSLTLLLPAMIPLACFAGSYAARFFDGEEATDAYNWSVELTIITVGLAAVLMTIFLFNILSELHPVGFWRFPGPVVIEKLHIIKDIPLDPPFPVWKLWLTPGPFILLLMAIVLYALHTMRRTRQLGIMMMVLWLVFLVFMKLLFVPVLQRPVHRQNALKIEEAIFPNKHVAKRLAAFSEKDIQPTIRPATIWIDGSDADLLPMLFYLNLKQNHPAKKGKAKNPTYHPPVYISREHPLADLSQWILQPRYKRLVGVMSEQQYYALPPEARENIRILQSRWKWVMLNPAHLPDFMNADYMKKLTHNTLVFETLPPNEAIDWQTIKAQQP